MDKTIFKTLAILNLSAPHRCYVILAKLLNFQNERNI